MKIDFHKLIELLLPTSLRQSRMIAFLHSLTVKPLQRLFVMFHIWRKKSRYDASVTPQVISLLQAIERIFDCVAEITELNGKPYDFLVTIDRSADLNAIREFIDKHKLAGKSYVFRLGDATFSVTWLSHVDEHLIEEYTAEWIDHIDTHGIDCFISYYWNNLADSDWPEITRGRVVGVYASEPVTSDLNFTIRIGTTNGITTEMITLGEGEREARRMATVQIPVNQPANIISATVSPDSDNYHYYDLTY